MADDAIIVKRVGGLDASERAAVRSDADVRLVETTTLPNTEVVTPRDGDVAGALAELDANPDVLYAERDLPASPATDDSLWGLLWGLPKISVADAWTRTTGAGATVAVVDSGIDTTHPDLAGQFTGNPGERGGGKETNAVDDDHNGFVDDWQGWDFANNDNTVETQLHQHGSHVAGTIAAVADNGVGIAGVAPSARILPVKVFAAPGSQASSVTIAQAFDYAGKLGVPVVNASLGGVGYSVTVENVINSHPNTLYVIAAGNDGANAAAYYPCNTEAANLVCVGASDEDDLAADFSNTSATDVDLFAPGVEIASTVPGGYVYMDGTSMATPHVAGAAALLAGAKPGATSLAIKSALLSSVDVRAAFAGLSVTSGRLNAAAATDAVLAITPTPTPTPTPEPPAPTPTPTPQPPAPTPQPPAPVPSATPTPHPAPVVSRLTVAGQVTARRSAKVTFALTANAKVSISVHRACGAKACASAVSRWSKSEKAGSRTFTLGRRVNGRTLKAGKYTLTVATNAGSRSVTFRVR
ncbi:S8 family serine peptidase [Solirubrobacter phytolaccae]|uniref:S8 family serine peptidase n=1 Tax=Solirubrobacter phytolaccae TaxID=1404360 RepID=A0A9X3N651_9ACTN|nr:S8 family serine peptidase [Solirubrobacter phytolaccae]MDA0180211.1 S8 family serine peptidase [Solirubrobacter phytolaccae]